MAGPLAPFQQAEVRFIPRPTDFYYQLVMQSYHPDMLRDALRRERHLDQLWTEVPALPWLARLIPSERADLWVGDIPRYASRPASRDVWDSRGAVIADLLPESGWGGGRGPAGLSVRC